MSTVAVAPHIEEAKTEMVPCLSTDTRNERIVLRQEQLEKTKLELASAMPAEGKDVEEVIRQHVELLECFVKNPTFEERYQCLSMKVLKWRNDNGFPRLVPFLLSDPRFSIGKTWNTTHHRNPHEVIGSLLELPEPMRDLYDDVLDLDLFKKGSSKEISVDQYNNVQVGITAKFNGVIPQWVRDEISSAAPDFQATTKKHRWAEDHWWRPWDRGVAYGHTDTHIFLITEVSDWVVNKEVIPYVDPLVVGYKGGYLWLICSFDETPLEEYARLEFSIRS